MPACVLGSKNVPFMNDTFGKLKNIHTEGILCTLHTPIMVREVGVSHTQGTTTYRLGLHEGHVIARILFCLFLYFIIAGDKV